MSKATKKKNDKKSEKIYPLTISDITTTTHVIYPDNNSDNSDNSDNPDTENNNWKKIAPYVIENPLKGDILRQMKKIQPAQLYEPISTNITDNIPNWKECLEKNLYLRIVSSPPHLQFWKKDITRYNNCKLEFIVTSIESAKFIRNYEETQKKTPVKKLMFVGTPIFVYGSGGNQYLDWNVEEGEGKTKSTLTEESCVFFISTNNNENCQKLMKGLNTIQSKMEPFIEGVESKQKLDTIHSYSLPIDITEKDWVNMSNIYPKREDKRDTMDLLWSPDSESVSTVGSKYESLIKSKYTDDVNSWGSEDELLLQSSEEISLQYLFGDKQDQREQQGEEQGEEQQDQKSDGSHLQLFQETDYPYGLVDLYNYWMYQNLLPVPGNQYSYRDIIDMSVYGEFPDDNSERVIVAPFINSPRYIFDRFTKQTFYKFIYTNNITVDDNVTKYKTIYNNFIKKNKKVLEEHLVKNIISKKPKFYWIYSKEKCIPFTINDLGSTHGSYKKLQDRMLIMKGHKKMTIKKKP